MGGESIFSLSFNPTIPDHELNWTCFDLGYYCYGTAGGSITGGTATGTVYHFDGTNYIPQAYFSGSISGGMFDKLSWNLYGTDYYWDKYWYDFSGTWTNGWITKGSGYSSPSSDGNIGEFTITTTTPEPGTLGLLGLGIVGFYSRLRRKD